MPGLIATVKRLPSLNTTSAFAGIMPKRGRVPVLIDSSRRRRSVSVAVDTRQPSVSGVYSSIAGLQTGNEAGLVVKDDHVPMELASTLKLATGKVPRAMS
jgi:hypothetical protein